ncbi:hypothetical protein SESBI_36348 [Sesbania bispinosa]|nr:hypothetical protein SESBI_36348 [Sesbania bispinosa]
MKEASGIDGYEHGMNGRAGAVHINKKSNHKPYNQIIDKGQGLVNDGTQGVG